MSPAMVKRLAVEAVVDVVDDELRAGLQVDKVGVVLLHRRRLGRAEAGLGVHVLLALVGRLGSDLARGVRVHTRQLLVHADVRVVHVDGLGAAKVANTRIVDLRVRSRRTKEGRSTQHLGEDLPTRHVGLRHRDSRAGRGRAHHGRHVGRGAAEAEDKKLGHVGSCGTTAVGTLDIRADVTCKSCFKIMMIQNHQLIDGSLGTVDFVATVRH